MPELNVPVWTGMRLSTKHADHNFILESLLTHNLCEACHLELFLPGISCQP